MTPHQKQTEQIKMWLALTAALAEQTANKNESEITKRDVIKVAQKVEDIINVLHGKSKIAGWRE